jgi:hypothetical protein
MSRYFVAYDLNGEQKKYKELKAELEKVCKFVVKRQKSFFLVDYIGLEEDLYTDLVHIVDEDDKLIIIGTDEVLEFTGDHSEDPNNLLTMKFIKTR